jgi:hypothetical protein
MEDKDLGDISKSNLDKLLKKIGKYKKKRDLLEVEIVLKSLPIYHCVPAPNILNVLQTQTIMVKNQVVRGEHTNNSTDYFQGFENHISMSIGLPWVVYGPYAFAYGLEHIHPRSLAFNEDPWLWGANRFHKNMLTKTDFEIYIKELLMRNLFMITKRFYIQLPWKANLHRIAERNFKEWEIKQAANLSIMDAEEFFIWTNIDQFVYTLLQLFGSKPILLLIAFVTIILVVGGIYL